MTGQVPPVTGESIAYGLWSAELLADGFRQGDPQAYERIWRGDYGDSLAVASAILPDRMDRAISSFGDAIERTPVSALAKRLAEREDERQLLLSEVGGRKAQRRYCRSQHIDDETLEILIRELRKGLLANRCTVRDTLRQVATKVEVTNNGGTLHFTLP